MNNTYIFVRHAETQKDPSKPAPEWDLTPDALTTINGYIAEGFFEGVSAVYASTEPKAIKTVEPVADSLGLQVKSLPEFNEVKRTKEFLTDEEFARRKEKQLSDLDFKSDDSEESGNEALARFKKGLAELDQKHHNEKIVIASHGTILSIYFADLLGDFSNLYERWQKLPFCAYGVVKDEQVIRDIL